MEQQEGLNVPVDKVIQSYQKRIGEMTHLIIMYESYMEQMADEVASLRSQLEKAEKAAPKAAAAKS